MTTEGHRPHAGLGVLYWVLVVVLIAFGAVGIFSVGLPFLVLGFVLGAIHPLRREPALFWTPVVAVVAFFAGWWLLGPVGCSAESTPNGRAERVSCESLAGVTYDGEPFWIGPTVGAVAAAVLGGATYVGLARRRSGARD